MPNKHGFFQTKPSCHTLGQEEYAFLKPGDYAIAPQVSCCMLIWVKYRDQKNQLHELVGHFANKNMHKEGRSPSYWGFRSLFKNAEVLDIAYATNWTYNKKALQVTAAALVEDTALNAEEVKSYCLTPSIAMLPYRPIIFYQRSAVFKSYVNEEDASKAKLETDLIEIAYPTLRQSCAIL